MNSEEEERLLAPVDEDKEESTTSKLDEVPVPCTRKRKGVTQSEFENLRVQVTSVTATINDFSDMLKSFIGSGEKTMLR